MFGFLFPANVVLILNYKVLRLCEIRVKSRNILIGGFYRPPISNTGYFELDRAYNTRIQYIYSYRETLILLRP